MDQKYGIVIDSGSSGSRIQVYKWDDVAQSREQGVPEILAGPPQITQEDGWSMKILPGISTFANSHKNVWLRHYKDLFDFAEKIVPPEKIAETPVFILSTAGMRLLPESQRQQVLTETCKAVKKNTKFYLGPCEDHVQTIDGLTEGVYGWLALNYLMLLFSGNSGSAQNSVGFMDMGGASTQIAFVPSQDEITRHDEDLSTVTLMTIDGKPQTWRVFVETWLGFGANQGRKRYLDNLILLAAASRPGKRLKVVLDPCMPAGSVLKKHMYEKKPYTIQGTGNYESCLREIYPLLMKHVPCTDEPCLFNGIHAPKMDFEKDKFVGVSEYWYTANDIFHSGGEYNFHSFNEKVKEFCESSWDTILQNSKNGEYLNLPNEYLLDTCFKASWVVNVLHEGFGLPRLALEIPDNGISDEAKEVEEVHVPFKSAESIEGKELSWTLGKMLLVASSQIQSQEQVSVGVVPSAISQKLIDIDSDSDDESLEARSWVPHFILWTLLCYVIYRYGRGFLSGPRRKFVSDWKPVVKDTLTNAKGKLPRVFAAPINKVINFLDLQQHEHVNMELEEGNSAMASQPQPGSAVLRTRSTMNFSESPEGISRPVDFMSKPFANPKTAAFYNHLSESRDSLLKLLSSSSISRLKN
ncbi:hypothetical protein HF325_002268 [Metschnikowia pulcherrima]|uniref:Golgi apyrase n=1 Tax=Metschnikowia pulcherrima TaxID=27326 RepID=A0A8H7GWI6_9ASCO|nr:hypothetical protein HF325_002268 [Metschnikowia pulcherrima]